MENIFLDHYILIESVFTLYNTVSSKGEENSLTALNVDLLNIGGIKLDYFTSFQYANYHQMLKDR